MKPATFKEVWKKLHENGYNIYSGTIVLDLVMQHALKYFNTSQKVLDIGCGNGDVFAWLHKYIGEYNAIDISEVACESTLKRFKDNEKLNTVIPCVGDGTIPYHLCNDKTFDVVMSCLVLQHIHIDFVEKYIQESHAVLKDNGLIIFHCTEWPNHKHDNEIRNMDMSYELQYNYVTGGVYSHTEDVMRPLFDKYGFDVIDFFRNDTHKHLASVGAVWTVYVARKR